MKHGCLPSASQFAATATEEMMVESMAEEKKGQYFLGEPTFAELENGRFRCLETGHELPNTSIPSYANSKRCRLGLINHALSHKTPPLNMFKQDPLSGSKLICNLTGDSVNKSEEHIWKHINGKRFLSKLEQKEARMLSPRSAKEVLKLVNDNVKNINSRFDKLKPRKFSDEDSDSEEADFWMPSVGSLCDFDDRGEQKAEDNNGTNGVNEGHENDSEELSIRMKRMSMAVGPSSFAPRKKKSK